MSKQDTLDSGDDLNHAEHAARDPNTPMDGVRSVLDSVQGRRRKRLFEHEVYAILRHLGVIQPPWHQFIPDGQTISPKQLSRFPGEQVVLKIVSEAIVHKTEAHGVVFAPNTPSEVNAQIAALGARHGASGPVAGVLVVECVPRSHPGFGNELFIGIRATREFGPVIAAGLGGIDTEYLAHAMRPGLAVAKAAVLDVTAEQFFALFQRTAAYDMLAGRARGHGRIVSDAELLRCLDAFVALARRFCVDDGSSGPHIGEFEVNPFAFRDQRMIPLDGRATLAPPTPAPAARPIEKIPALLAPQSIAVLGASSSTMNYGRIILRNIAENGFPRERLHAISRSEGKLDGVQCVPDIESLPEPVDLLVISVGANQLPEIAEQVVAGGKVHTAIMISGGAGETEGTDEIRTRTESAIRRGRARDDGGPVFLGPNCMGVQSRPGLYDTFFVPPEHMDFRRKAPARRCALISQSGAFAITRLDVLETLDPAFTVTIGNQIDLTLSDLLTAIGMRDDIDVVGVYAEGFSDLDGLAFLHAVQRVSAAGKVVVFYKAGRTASGRSAAAGHTTAVAGDYDVCQAAVGQAGAIVVDTFTEFGQLMELATALHDKSVAGRRIAAITNAGFEAVGMADTIRGARYEIELAEYTDAAHARIEQVLQQHGMAAMANIRNPIDLTSMATEPLYEDVAHAMLDCPQVDALVLSCVPMSPTLKSAPHEIDNADSLAARLPRLFAESRKPLIAIVDAGPLYDPLARSIRARGVPMFRTADQAIRSLGRYLCHRRPK